MRAVSQPPCPVAQAARLIGNQKESNTGTHVRNWFGALLHEAIQMSADLKARELANIAWACAKVQQVVGARHSFVDWRHLMSLREAIHTSMPSMDAQGLANSLWSLVRPPAAPHAACSPPQVPRMRSEGPPARDGRPCSQSKLQVDLPGQWLVSYTQALKTRLVNFNEQELANTLLGLAQAQSDARPTINEATLMVTAECGNKMASFSTQGLSNTIWALGRLSCKPPQPWIDAFLRTCVEVPISLRAHLASSSRAWRSLLPRRGAAQQELPVMHFPSQKFDQFTPQGLSNTMSGFALLSISPPDVLWASIHAKVVAESENFTVPTVATMLHAMATMATQGPPGIGEKRHAATAPDGGPIFRAG